MNTQHQGDLPDCGPFAVAFVTSLLFGEDPTNLEYDMINIRDHLKKCIETNNFVPFPSIPKFRTIEIIQSKTVDIYCTCRCPEFPGQFMIECEVCHVWFHAPCVSIITKKQRKEAEKNWSCEKCL